MNLARPVRHVWSRPLVRAQTKFARPIIPFVAATRAQSTDTQTPSTASTTPTDPSDTKSAAATTPYLNELPDAREVDEPRLPRAVQALYLQPLRREAEFGVPSCSLQLRSYNIHSLDFFCDFALRAAYYLGLPAYGPVHLPKITERWTVPRDHFIFKKSQENYERITRRRLIQIRDGHPETVQIWLAYLQKHAHWGIGMKANMWEYDSLDTGTQMDAQSKAMKESVNDKMQALVTKGPLGDAMVEKVKEMLAKERFQATA